MWIWTSKLYETFLKNQVVHQQHTVEYFSLSCIINKDTVAMLLL